MPGRRSSCDVLDALRGRRATRLARRFARGLAHLGLRATCRRGSAVLLAAMCRIKGCAAFADATKRSGGSSRCRAGSPAEQLWYAGAAILLGRRASATCWTPAVDAAQRAGSAGSPTGSLPGVEACEHRAASFTVLAPKTGAFFRRRLRATRCYVVPRGPPPLAST